MLSITYDLMDQVQCVQNAHRAHYKNLFALPFILLCLLFVSCNNSADITQKEVVYYTIRIESSDTMRGDEIIHVGATNNNKGAKDILWSVIYKIKHADNESTLTEMYPLMTTKDSNSNVLSSAILKLPQLDQQTINLNTTRNLCVELSSDEIYCVKLYNAKSHKIDSIEKARLNIISSTISNARPNKYFYVINN